MSQDRRVPSRVYIICHAYNAWIVGSAAYPVRPGQIPEIDDVDVMVPWAKWKDAALHVPDDARPNAFGGWKWTDKDEQGNDVVVDMWPDTLDRLASKNQFHAAWHPASGLRIFAEDKRKLG